MNRRVLAVLLHEDVGAAEDVEVGGHLCCTRLTAASASAAVMSGRARWTPDAIGAHSWIDLYCQTDPTEAVDDVVQRLIFWLEAH